MPSLAHKDDEYQTPPWLFEDAEKETGLKFNLDVAATRENSKCDIFIGDFKENGNALTTDWNRGIAKDPSKMGTITSIDTIYIDHPVIFCNAPRSLNGKFVDKGYEQWQTHNIDIVMLLCWNDLGNKYGQKLLPRIINGDIRVKNLGKVKFYKNGIESEFPSRLTYFRCWFRSK